MSERRRNGVVGETVLTEDAMAMNHVGSYPAFVRVRFVCTELSLGRTTVYELIQSGRLPSVRVGKAVRVTGDGLARFIESLREDGGVQR